MGAPQRISFPVKTQAFCDGPRVCEWDFNSLHNTTHCETKQEADAQAYRTLLLLAVRCREQAEYSDHAQYHHYLLIDADGYLWNFTTRDLPDPPFPRLTTEARAFALLQYHQATGHNGEATRVERAQGAAYRHLRAVIKGFHAHLAANACAPAWVTDTALPGAPTGMSKAQP